MKTKILITTCLLTLSNSFAQEEKITFEQAVFLQETEKNYAAAIATYKKIIESSKKAHEARYRLAQCYKAMGDERNYLASMKVLAAIKDDTNEWVKLANKEVPKGIVYGPATWEDGDVSLYESNINRGPKNSFILIYEKIELPTGLAWKQTTLNVALASRSECIFDTKTYKPISVVRTQFIRDDDKSLKHDFTEKTWDGISFPSVMLYTIPKLLTFDSGKEYQFIMLDDKKYLITLKSSESSKFIFENSEQEFLGKKVFANITNGLDSQEFELGYSSGAKKELLSTSVEYLKVFKYVHSHPID